MKITTFNAFKSRNYGLYFIGQSISLIGTWMQKTAVSWVIYSLTHSKFMLGLSLFASMFPSFIFSFLGGATADRYNRYRLLLITQIASMVQAVLLTLLIVSKHYSVWEILALSFILSYPSVSTVIPGIRTEEHVVQNTNGLQALDPSDLQLLQSMSASDWVPVLEEMERQG